MKFRGHTCGLFASISVGSFATTILAVFIVALSFPDFDSAWFLYLLVVAPVFLGSYFLSSRLYLNRFRLSCPDCGEEMKTNYKPGVPVTYACDNCGYSYNTKITIGGGGDWR